MAGIIGKAETDFGLGAGAIKTWGKADLGKQDFLNLLVAQLQHQDPLNPMEDKEFTAQLAQFSSLEQLNAISDGINTMAQQSAYQDMFAAVDFIGKSVRATGSSISKGAETTSVVYYDLDRDVAKSLINIFDSAGNMVDSEDLGAQNMGSHEFVWDGKNKDGNVLDDGIYYFAMAAEDENGQAALIYPDVSGEVAGVVTENGSHYLRLTDGRYINLLQVKEVVKPAENTQNQDTETDG
ncbi:MAG: flagellar hook assembly protein FlgD [Desulfovibrionaceae bacterium]|nr:flagellar hook assembly protein FlgD [Desulfovibrionaceae bacterium]